MDLFSVFSTVVDSVVSSAVLGTVDLIADSVPVCVIDSLGVVIATSFVVISAW